MKQRTVFKVLAAGLALGSATCFAQQQEIVVAAPRIQVAHSQAFANDVPVDVISVSHIVSYSNIDISTSSGAAVLKQRIADAAKAACNEIETAYPNRRPMPGDKPCEKSAYDSAMVQANAAIAAAEKARLK